MTTVIFTLLMAFAIVSPPAIQLNTNLNYLKTHMIKTTRNGSMITSQLSSSIEIANIFRLFGIKSSRQMITCRMLEVFWDFLQV